MPTVETLVTTETARPPTLQVEGLSVLFFNPEDARAAEAASAPDYVDDLNLDQVLTALVSGREEYHLEPFFWTPLHSVDAVAYRHEILDDLKRPEVADAVEAFAEGMREVRTDLGLVRRMRHSSQKDALFLDAAGRYIDAVQRLTDALADTAPTSRGLRRLSEHLDQYVASAAFEKVSTTVGGLVEAMAAVRYTLRLRGATVTVDRYAGQEDYSQDVRETFARFRQHEVASRESTGSDLLEANQVEERILNGLARLFPDAFGARAAFRARHGDILDPVLVRFDREVQFYLAYLQLTAPLRAAALPFCTPDVCVGSTETDVVQAYDLALAPLVLAQGGAVIANDLRLSGPERIIVVTGPNNGGKTTFARVVGQLHHLAALGLPVPAQSARLHLPDRIFTHFGREEDVASLRGKFEDELVRMRHILDHASAESLIVMNESFGSTSLSDALMVGTVVVRAILQAGSTGVYVTFVDEIASLSEATVSMVAQVDPRDPTVRTFRVIRAPADGRAYAWAVAEKYGLTYPRLTERLTARGTNGGRS